MVLVTFHDAVSSTDEIAIYNDQQQAEELLGIKFTDGCCELLLDQDGNPTEDDECEPEYLAIVELSVGQKIDIS